MLLFGILLQGATLERLSLEDMIQKSTAIVRARVSGSYAAPHGSLIYTHYKVQVSERWKGPQSAELDVVVPGGTAGGFRLSIPGAPKLAEGSEYILFLWTGASGLTHVIGLSQGLFDLKLDAKGNLVASRAASTDIMLDSFGRTVKDEPLVMLLKDLRQRVATSLAAGGRR